VSVAALRSLDTGPAEFAFHRIAEVDGGFAFAMDDKGASGCARKGPQPGYQPVPVGVCRETAYGVAACVTRKAYAASAKLS
jgi:hypothetical protein